MVIVRGLSPAIVADFFQHSIESRSQGAFTVVYVTNEADSDARMDSAALDFSLDVLEIHVGGFRRNVAGVRDPVR